MTRKSPFLFKIDYVKVHQNAAVSIEMLETL